MKRRSSFHFLMLTGSCLVLVLALVVLAARIPHLRRLQENTVGNAKDKIEAIGPYSSSLVLKALEAAF